MMDNCIYYAGNQYCNLHKSKVASVYCGDICNVEKEESRTNIGHIGDIKIISVAVVID